jgi:Fic family protein
MDYNDPMRAKTHFEFVPTYLLAQKKSSRSFEKHFSLIAQKAIHFQLKIGDYPCFFYLSHPMELLLNDLLSKNAELSSLLTTLSPSSTELLLEKTLINESLASLSLDQEMGESNDAFLILHNDDVIPENPALTSLLSSYALLLQGAKFPLNDIADIRHLYDALLRGALDKDERPSGALFRNESYSHEISLANEEAIKYALKEGLSILGMAELSPYAKAALLDFAIRYAHPFQVGAGRLARFVTSSYLLDKASPLVSFHIAQAIKKEEKSLSKAYKKTFDSDNRGDLSCYVYTYLNALSEEFDVLIYSLRRKRKIYEDALAKKDEVNPLLKERLLSSAVYGVVGESIYDLASQNEVSIRTMTRYLNSFKDKGLLESSQIGKAIYYRYKLS